MERIVERAIERGYATSKTEVVRMALANLDKELGLSEEAEYRLLAERSFREVWDNPADEKASKFYEGKEV